MFWTDLTQANERLRGTFILYDNSRPFYVEQAIENDKGKACLYGYFCKSEGKISYQYIPLDDEKWNNFRTLPPLGWFNFITKDKTIIPVYLKRRAINTRTHGLTHNNSYTLTFRKGYDKPSKSESVIFNNVFQNQGYIERCEDKNNYPLCSEIVNSITENEGCAFSSLFCVFMSNEGIRWLFRKNQRIGLFTGVDTLTLFPKFSYLVEEITERANFDIANVREF